MGTYLFVEGIRKSDDKFKQMKAVWDACMKADIELPKEIQKFFNWRDPDKEGLRVKLTEEHGLEKEDFSYKGIIEIAKLPDNITHIIIELR